MEIDSDKLRIAKEEIEKLKALMKWADVNTESRHYAAYSLLQFMFDKDIWADEHLKIFYKYLMAYLRLHPHFPEHLKNWMMDFYIEWERLDMEIFIKNRKQFSCPAGQLPLPKGRGLEGN